MAGGRGLLPAGHRDGGRVVLPAPGAARPVALRAQLYGVMAIESLLLAAPLFIFSIMITRPVPAMHEDGHDILLVGQAGIQGMLANAAAGSPGLEGVATWQEGLVFSIGAGHLRRTRVPPDRHRPGAHRAQRPAGPAARRGGRGGHRDLRDRPSRSTTPLPPIPFGSGPAATGAGLPSTASRDCTSPRSICTAASASLPPPTPSTT